VQFVQVDFIIALTKVKRLAWSPLVLEASFNADAARSGHAFNRQVVVQGDDVNATALPSRQIGNGPEIVDGGKIRKERTQHVEDMRLDLTKDVRVAQSGSVSRNGRDTQIQLPLRVINAGGYGFDRGCDIRTSCRVNYG